MASPPHDTPKRPQRGILSRGSSFLGAVTGDSDSVGDGLILLDVIETFFDSRLDLIERRLKVHSDRLKSKAGEVISKNLSTVRSLAPKSPRIFAVDDDADDADGTLSSKSSRGSSADLASLGALDPSAPTDGSSSSSGRPKTEREKWLLADRELRKFKTKVSSRLVKLTQSWESSRTLRTRDKVSFFFGVMTVLTSALMFGLCPEWIPVWYTVQSAFYLPLRVWSYKKKEWHYFLFDMCYYVNILDLLWMWAAPNSTVFFTACYLLTLGPLASAIVTWRNSLVFHSLDKVTSLFIHIYPPFTMTVILHHYPGREERWPGIVRVGGIPWWQKMILGIGFYIVWQVAYWQFVMVAKREKITSGSRVNSFSHLLQDKHNVIGKWMRATPAEKRESLFMFWQLVYTVVTFVPPVALLWWSPTASGSYLIALFGQATWNGGSYYTEVWGRRFERELEALKKEMAAAVNATTPSPSTTATTTSSPVQPSTGTSTSVSVGGPAAGGSSSSDGTTTTTTTQRSARADDDGSGPAGEEGLASDAALLNSPLALGEPRTLPVPAEAGAQEGGTKTPAVTPTPVGERSEEIGGGKTE